MNHTHPLVILHLSDLHFGWNGADKNELANRNLALNGLLSRLAELDREWKPDLVCITGDIGWAGEKNDYKATKEWILNLLDTLSLTPDDLFVCPGNHDSYRPLAITNARPGTAEEADQGTGCSRQGAF
jgi:3',5'-cyclic AMP phosphodiesterase CpdA